MIKRSLQSSTLIADKYLLKRSYSFEIWNASSRVWHITSTETWKEMAYCSCYWLQEWDIPLHQRVLVAEVWPVRTRPFYPYRTLLDKQCPFPELLEEYIHVELQMKIKLQKKEKKLEFPPHYWGKISPSEGCSNPQSIIARRSSGFRRKSRNPLLWIEA